MNTTRNIYREGVDFTTLALQCPDFAKHLKGNGQLDFSNPDSVQQLTKSLLQRDFELKLELPSDRLCPPVPNRLNYILWIQDLVDTTSDEYTDGFDSERDVIGLDIGTGASCIYPLLGCQQRPRWRFGATDIDEKNIDSARENVSRNGLKARVRLVKTLQKDPLINLKAIGVGSLDFIMCNPPFYSSKDELITSAKEKCRPPFSACTGAEVEMVTEGGEVAFVSSIISESVKLRDSVQWYSSMLGKSQSVPIIVETLKKAGVTNWGVTAFVQGSKTRRWAVAWSWGDLRPSMNVSRGAPGFPKHLLPFPSEFSFSPNLSMDQAAVAINTALGGKDSRIQWQWDAARASGVGFAMENVWSRQARRKQQGRSSQGVGGLQELEIDEDEATLGFKVSLGQRKEQSEAEVTVRWLKGTDEVLFESFCGMLKRKVEIR